LRARSIEPRLYRLSQTRRIKYRHQLMSAKKPIPEKMSTLASDDASHPDISLSWCTCDRDCLMFRARTK
jgi:hypothetical protein